MGTDFANDGNLIMSSANLARFFPLRAAGADPLSAVDLGIVKVQPGADRPRRAAGTRPPFSRAPNSPCI